LPPHGAPGDKGEALKAVESRSPGDRTDSLSIQEESKTIYSTGPSTRTLCGRSFNWSVQVNTKRLFVNHRETFGFRSKYDSESSLVIILS